jgi:GAF domain-containing protein
MRVTDLSVLVAVLARFAQNMHGRYDVTEVLYELGERVTEVLSVAGCGVSLGDADGQLRFASASSEAIAELERSQEHHQEGPCRTAFVSGEPFLCSDIAELDGYDSYRKAALEVGMSAVAGIPMFTNGVKLGALNVYDCAPRRWQADEVDAARILADVASAYVVHATELADARRLSEQLQYALDSRVITEQAKGLLAGVEDISVEEAFTRIRRYARQHQRSVRRVAEAVMQHDLRPPGRDHPSR